VVSGEVTVVCNGPIHCPEMLEELTLPGIVGSRQIAYPGVLALLGDHAGKDPNLDG
jgi:hypothetical protein